MNPHKDPHSALADLEIDLGESVLYRATGRFLAVTGLDAVPLDSWGLVVLTPTRILYRHFSQSHPLLGGREEEVRWQVARSRFDHCEAVLQSFWSKLFSGAPDHVSFTGPGVHLALETADDQKRLPFAWAQGSP